MRTRIIISLTRSQVEFLLTVLEATGKHHVMLLRRQQAKRTAAAVLAQAQRQQALGRDDGPFGAAQGRPERGRTGADNADGGRT